MLFRSVGVGVGRTSARGVALAVGVGVGRGAGVAAGVGGVAGVGSGLGTGVGVGCEEGRLNPSRPGIVWGGVPPDVCAAAPAAVPASSMAIAPVRARREMFMDPVLTRKPLRAP